MQNKLAVGGIAEPSLVLEKGLISPYNEIMKKINSSQVKVTISDKLKNLLKQRAEEYGLTLSGYVKNLIIDDIREIPVFPMSEEREKVALQALKDQQNSEIEEIKDVDKFVDSLL